MKPHTYNQISLTLLRHIAEIKVSPEAKHLLLFLCSWAEVNYPGIVRASFYTMSFFTGIETGIILKAFKELEKAGEIINGDEPDWLFVVNKWAHEPNVGMKVAKGTWDSLIQYPIGMVSEFKKRYGDTHSIPIAYPFKLEYTDTDTETETETDICPRNSSEDGSLPESKPEKKPKRKTRTAEDWLISEDPAERVLGAYVLAHNEKWEFKPTIPFAHALPNVRTCFKRGITEGQMTQALTDFARMDPDQCDEYQSKWVTGHKWELLIKHIDDLVKVRPVVAVGVEADEAEFLRSKGLFHD